jgi:hypothetical protein
MDTVNEKKTETGHMYAQKVYCVSFVYLLSMPNEQKWRKVFFRP